MLTLIHNRQQTGNYCVIVYLIHNINVTHNSESLAWVGVQIHCYSTADETRVAIDDGKEEQSTVAFTHTSFNPCLMKGEKGRVLFASEPKILFCDLQLMPNESKSFIYCETIPNDAIPSYNGVKVKYQYKLSIGAQRVNSAIQTMRIPLRVLSITNTSLPNYHNNHNSGNSVEEYANSSCSSTPDISNNEWNFSDSVLDISLHKLEYLTAKRRSNSYIISNQFGRVAKFCLLKSTFKLGEDIIGIFNFTESTIPCIQVCNSNAITVHLIELLFISFQ